MRSERVIWGLIFLFIGGILLLDNFGTIDFHWEIIWRFWPLVLIILGVNMLIPNEDSGRGGVISIIVTIAALTFIGYQGTLPDSRFGSRLSWDNGGDEENKEETEEKSNIFSEPISSTTRYATLNIEGGATKYELKDTTSELFFAELRKHGGNYSVYKTTNDSTEEVTFSMSGKQRFDSDNAGGGKASIKLNSKPFWDIKLEVGAGKIDFDLRPFKVRSLNLEGGAASFNFKMGPPQGITKINTETGVSKLTISIPESAACEIHTDTGLSANDFDDFEKREDGTFVTPGYDRATDKFIINIKGGLSRAKVERY